MTASATAAPRRATKLTLQEALAAARETRALVVGPGVLCETGRVFREQFPGARAVVIADERTLPVAGSAVGKALATAGVSCVAPFIFTDPALYAEFRFIEQLEASLRQHDAIPIAVGSGTINDLTKLAAHQAGRRYMCVATAASMDGYTAYGASITHQGSKQTFDCPAPVAVIADLDVIAAAPAEMSAWGYADLLAKVTAGADWIVADALRIEPLEYPAWDIVQGGLREAVGNPAGVRSRDRAAIAGLVEGLMLGGFAMQAMRSSRPASGAEHQFSHLWDMQHHSYKGNAPSHGAKVGIATLAITALYEALLEMPLESLDVERCCGAWPDEAAWVQRAGEQFSDPELQAVAVREVRAKHPSTGELRTQLERLRAGWAELRERLRAQLIPSATLRSMLQAAGAATDPEEIGISRARLRDTFFHAFFIRRRFTVLDLAVRTGTLETLLDGLFGVGGPWEISPAR